MKPSESKGFFISMFVCLLLSVFFASPAPGNDIPDISVKAGASIAVLKDGSFVVVREGGKSVELYTVQGGRIVLKDAAFLLTDQNISARASTYKLQHFKVK